ncbi:uncharacterized protein PV09_03096 [Verruconis gallopava]|uniref:Uncharacterized protein n=1 Tax=Verruconis gallopava TaxID=253628 RepID=A0A0D1YYY7_9PEZI|nr:uncharacterized protein PV09_03096 [Verruconis gallopava]KIW05902.1 hypothetical protein PV09_03096 [Verruconis gallopava]
MSKPTSPTAQLLRNSRLFSLPQALPRPIVEQPVAGGFFRSSDTATTPYPLRQAIITPNSSASRGDWGLKRPLPKRIANRSSEPVHTVVANDTYEGVTEYHSASPHVKTLERFQELNIGMTRQDRKAGIRDVKLSAMESSLDFTDPEIGRDRRWKFENGHVRTMTPAEFDEFLRKKVAGKRDEFMLQLQARVHRQQLVDICEKEKEAMETGSSTETQSLDPDAYAVRKTFMQWVLLMTDAQLTQYLQQLRIILGTGEQRQVGPDGSIPSELADEFLSLAMDPGGQVSEGDLQTLAASTFSAALSHTLKTKWWSRDLEEDSSHQGNLLRQKLANAQTPKSGLPAVGRPAIGRADAQQWLKYLGLAEQHEKEFLRSWITKEWDPKGEILQKSLHQLRNDITLESPLNKHIREFLDMPPTRTSASLATLPDGFPGANYAAENTFSLSTHPTAGLSYLRTNSILHNHPILGPQRSDPPVKARFIANKHDQKGSIAVGVAGFVAEERGEQKPDVVTNGGHKFERQIKNVYVEGDARIHFELGENRDKEAVRVRDGQLDRGAVDWKTAQQELASSHLMSVLKAHGRRKERHDPASPATRISSPARAKPLENQAVDALKTLRSILRNGGQSES